ncbi:unnamed protein product, partial [Didymodactylos carnosus]
MNKENFRFYIKVCTALHIELKAIRDELYSVFGDEAPSHSTVVRWSKRFREGEPRPGQPVTEKTTENIEEVRGLIDDDDHLTIDEIHQETGLSHGTIVRIISDHPK